MITPEAIAAPRLGESGEPCAACGASLAPDQRYCLNCGQRRAESRVPYAEVLRRPGAEVASATTAAAPVPSSVPGPPAPGWNQMTALVGVGVVTVVLGVGVLIGRSVSSAPKRVSAPQVISVGAGPATAPQSTPASKAKVTKGKKAGASATGPAKTVSRQQLNQLNTTSGSDYFKKSQKLPKKIAIPGPPPATDKKAPGGGSGGGGQTIG